MTMIRPLLLAMLISCCLVVGCGETVPVETVAVNRGSIQQYIDERGKTRLPETHLITMPFDGRIEAIELVEGDAVAVDQVVAEIVERDLALAYDAADAAVQRLDESIEENADTRVEDVIRVQAEKYVASMTSAVSAAEARMEAGRKKKEFGEKTHGRMKQAFDQGAATAEELDRAEVVLVESSVDYQQDVLVHKAMKALYAATELFPDLVDKYVETKTLAGDVLRKQKLEATTQLAMQEQRKQRGVLHSPIDGIVLKREVSNERFLAGGKVLLRIGRLEDLEIEVDVLSQDVGDVQVGDAVEIYGPAVGSLPARGEVSRVFPEGFTKTSSLGVEQQRVKVIVDIDPEELARLRKDRNLGVEFRVRVRIITATDEDALLVPRSALFRDATAAWQVFVVQGGFVERRSVEVGLLNETVAQVTTGLQAGDQVVAVPESSLEHGARVDGTSVDAKPAGAP